MTTALQHIAHAHAQAEEEARHDAEPAPLWEQLAWARHMAARLGDVDGLVDLAELDAGVCGECGGEAFTRFRLGAFELCRPCATRRLNARDRRVRRTVVPELHLEGTEPPASLSGWAKRAGHTITDKAIEAHLDEWGVHGEQREKLLTIARHVRDGVASKAAT